MLADDLRKALGLARGEPHREGAVWIDASDSNAASSPDPAVVVDPERFAEHCFGPRQDERLPWTAPATGFARDLIGLGVALVYGGWHRRLHGTRIFGNSA